MKKITVEASRIWKGFKVGAEFRDIVKDLSFDVPSGQLTFITGPNGVGKTIFGQILCGLLPLDSGTIIIDGKSYPRLDRATAKSLGIEYLPQQLPKPENLTSVEFLSLDGDSIFYSPSTIKKQLKTLQSRVELAIPRKLTERISWRTRPFELQALYLAKALISQCRFLLLDEPTAYLSTDHAKDLIVLLRALVEQQGLTIVVIAHPEQQALSGSRFFEFAGNGITPATGEASPVFPKLARTERLWPIPNWSLTLASQKRIVLKPGMIACIKGTATRDFFEFAEMFKDAPSNLLEVTPASKKLRVAFISEDETQRGIAGDRDLLENSLIGHWKDRYWTTRFPIFINRRKAQALLVDPVLEELNVQPRDRGFLAKNLSGGNKQRLVISRTCFGNVDLLIAVGLFNGLDENGVYRVCDFLWRKSAMGMTAILFSTRFGVEETVADVTLKYTN